MNTDPQQTYLQISKGTYATDPNGLSNPSAASQLAAKYGINKTRFFVHPTPETDYVALNTTRPAFGPRTPQGRQLRDRPGGAAARLRLRGRQDDDGDPPAVPRGRRRGHEPLPAQRLQPAEGEVADGRQVRQRQPLVPDRADGTPQSGILSYNLKQLGCTVTTKPFQGYAMFTAAGVKGAAFDAAIAGWYQDYADGYDFFHILLDGRTIASSNNNNLAYFNEPSVNSKSTRRTRRPAQTAPSRGASSTTTRWRTTHRGRRWTTATSVITSGRRRPDTCYPGVRLDGPRNAVFEVTVCVRRRARRRRTNESRR